MKLKKKLNLPELFKSIYTKIIKLDDTPQRVALGFGIGIFLGILPGTGPIAAVFSAALLRLNKASALIGSLLVNTWINIATFILAVKIGSALMRLDWQQVYTEALPAFKNYHFVNFFKLAFLKLALPVLLGYLAIAFFTGLFAYLITLFILNCSRNKRA